MLDSQHKLHICVIHSNVFLFLQTHAITVKVTLQAQITKGKLAWCWQGKGANCPQLQLDQPSTISSAKYEQFQKWHSVNAGYKVRSVTSSWRRINSAASVKQTAELLQPLLRVNSEVPSWVLSVFYICHVSDLETNLLLEKKDNKSKYKVFKRSAHLLTGKFSKPAGTVWDSLALNKTFYLQSAFGSWSRTSWLPHPGLGDSVTYTQTEVYRLNKSVTN